ncbi:RluA family pseudouridine synthase [Thalassolituus oleivorans]|uniref:RluA family pseudouridine synthase n=1 Tax=Thalassolituus oleivorans TaxID=187493 RepID=UPI00240A177F|nr:RluA family pseudouridine synthase [Thalassolituus oleivorans]MDF1640117.1 RluA family pseudouridine synthase [Thalassolituus oleivorans]
MTAIDYIAPHFPRLNLDELAQYFADERVWLKVSEDNHAEIKQILISAHYVLQTHDRLYIEISNHSEDPVNTQWTTVWENHELLAIYKPPLLPVSRTTRNLYGTLISLVRRHSPWTQAQLLHRLDTETSGLILLAKNSYADKKWKKKFERLMQGKIYHAWVFGKPDWQEITLECDISEREDSAIRSRMYVVEDDVSDFKNPKFSKTHFQVIRNEGDRSLIECRLFTGKKHQIRAHLAYLGYPIVGDKIYAFDGRYYLKRFQSPLTAEDFRMLGSEHHLLQAVRLELCIEKDSIQTIELK